MRAPACVEVLPPALSALASRIGNDLAAGLPDAPRRHLSVYQEFAVVRDPCSIGHVARYLQAAICTLQFPVGSEASSFRREEFGRVECEPKVPSGRLWT